MGVRNEPIKKVRKVWSQIFWTYIFH